MARFSKKARQRLEQAGWTPQRRTNSSDKRFLVENTGLKPTQEMLDFLREFDGLHLTYSNGQCLFDFRSYPHDFMPEKCEYRNSMLGEQVLLIGSMSNDDFIVVLGESGSMYAYDEGYKTIIELGESYDDGLETICSSGMNPYKLTY